MTLTFELGTPPLKADQHGTIRVSNTRVTLDTLVILYKQGSSAEELHEGFPTVPLADVHAVIAYYLRNQEAVDGYIAEAERGGIYFDKKSSEIILMDLKIDCLTSKMARCFRWMDNKLRRHPDYAHLVTV